MVRPILGFAAGITLGCCTVALSSIQCATAVSAVPHAVLANQTLAALAHPVRLAFSLWRTDQGYSVVRSSHRQDSHRLPSLRWPQPPHPDHGLLVVLLPQRVRPHLQLGGQGESPLRARTRSIRCAGCRPWTAMLRPALVRRSAGSSHASALPPLSFANQAPGSSPLSFPFRRLPAARPPALAASAMSRPSPAASRTASARVRPLLPSACASLARVSRVTPAHSRPAPPHADRPLTRLPRSPSSLSHPQAPRPSSRALPRSSKWS